MTKKDTMCEQCTPPKRIVGANPEVRSFWEKRYMTKYHWAQILKWSASPEVRSFPKRSDQNICELKYQNYLLLLIDCKIILIAHIFTFPSMSYKSSCSCHFHQGCRTALICHLAIQHEELKEARLDTLAIEHLNVWIYLQAASSTILTFGHLDIYINQSRWWSRTRTCLLLW